ncbi:MAG TPA: type IV pilus assembly protein PilM [Fimbriimonadaceae bacterium]|nr:type IV pilus assembly protein PilM [Fimbriimonadaceae bacterium]
MAKKLNSVLGIDIGSRRIKIAEVRSSGGSPTVTALGMVDTPEGAVDHTGVYNSDAVGDAIKQAIQESGASVPHAVVSIAGQASVLVRTLEVPRMNPSELKEHMQWEINRNIPFAESTVVSDFKPLRDDDPASQHMDVVMAISPQSAIDTLVACMKRAGRTTAAIDVEPMGLARSVKASYDDLFGSQSVCVIDVGHKTTSINIYKDGKLLMPRTVPVGGEMFTQAIVDGMGVSASEAEGLKSQVDLTAMDISASNAAGFGGGGGGGQDFVPYNPFADDSNPFAAPAAAPEPTGAFEPAPANDVSSIYADEPINQPQAEPEPEPPMSAPAPVPVGDSRAMSAVAPVLDEFVAEIRRSIDYFRSRGGEVDRLMICGGGAKMKGMADFLGKSLNMPCDLFDPLRRLNVSAKKADSGFIDAHREEFAIAVGNGLHILFD